MSEGGAEEAFDNLRGEVGLLRRAIEGLLAEPSNASSREIAVQLASQAGELKRLSEETQRLAGQPVLSLTPEALAEQLKRMRRCVDDELRAPWKAVMVDVEGVSAELTHRAGLVKRWEQQRRLVAIVALTSAVLTLTAWLVLSGPIARALPKEWQVAERMAAATLGENRWEAGQRLMSTADPASWGSLEAARELMAHNAQTLKLCARGPTRPGAKHRCTIDLPHRD